MSSPIREAFIERLRSQFYAYLKVHRFFKDWGDTLALYELSHAILELNRGKIEEYLDSKKFTLKESDKVIESIMKEFLIPSLQDLQI